MIPKDITDEALELVRHIAPEFKIKNLYLVDGADLERVEPCDCFAYASRSADPRVRDHLEALGDWAGQGSTIVYLTDEIRSGSNDFRRAFLEVTLHEIAHLLPLSMIAPPDIEFTAEDRQRDAAAHLQFATKSDGDVVASGHGPDFIRIAAHVWFRAVAIGYVAEAHHMFAGYKYNLSHPLEYYEALGGEPFTMSGELFNTIARKTPPAKFTALWNKDLARLEQLK